MKYTVVNKELNDKWLESDCEGESPAIVKVLRSFEKAVAFAEEQSFECEIEDEEGDVYGILDGEWKVVFS